MSAVLKLLENTAKELHVANLALKLWAAKTRLDISTPGTTLNPVKIDSLDTITGRLDRILDRLESSPGVPFE